MNIKTAYTIGFTKSYDQALANEKNVRKCGMRDDYPGGWVWKSFEEADNFRLNAIPIVEPEWVPEESSVYEIKLPNGFNQDISPTPGEDGVHNLINDALIIRKVV